MKIKSQSAIEFMTMVGLGLILIAVTSFIGADYISSYFNDINIINGKQTVNTITAASNLVYSQGIGAQTRIAVTIPNNIDPSLTYIYGQQVGIRLQQQGTQDIFRSTGVNITGTMPLTPGKKYLYLRMTPTIYSDIYGEIPGRGVKVYLDEPEYSYILGHTTDNSLNFVSNFSTTETIYYGIFVTDLNDTLKTPFVELKIYNSSGSVVFEDEFELNYWSQPFTITETLAPDTYLLSVKVPEVNAVGTSFFYIY